MAQITVQITESWPRTLDIVQKIAFEQFMNGEKISESGLLLDTTSFALLHVENPDAQSKEYDVACFVTDTGIFYTGSDTVKETAVNIINRVTAEKKDVRVFNFRTGSRQSSSNKGRTYLTLQLLGVECGEKTD